MKTFQFKPTIVSAMAVVAMLALPLASFAQSKGGEKGGSSATSGTEGSHGGAGSAGAKGAAGAAGGAGKSGAGGAGGGGTGAGGRGGKPPWSAGALGEEVELGRLNAARAPAKSLDQAATKAADALDPTFFSGGLPGVLANIAAGKTATGDSPREALGLYRDVMVGGGKVAAKAPGVSTQVLAATFLGAAAGTEEESPPITAAMVDGLNTVMGITLPPGMTSAQLAADAESVRTAMVAAPSTEGAPSGAGGSAGGTPGGTGQ